MLGSQISEMLLILNRSKIAWSVHACMYFQDRETCGSVVTVQKYLVLDALSIFMCKVPGV